jgi:hypothetical protein
MMVRLELSSESAASRGAVKIGRTRGSSPPLVFLGTFLLGVVLLFATASSALALPERFFGMTAFETAYDQSGNEYGEPNWTAMQNAGVQKFRLEVKWSKVVAAGNWKEASAWQNTYDHYFANAAKHGIAILPYLYTRKSSGPNLKWYYQVSPVQDSQYPEWLEFVSTVVQRYGQNGYFWSANPGLPQYPVDTWEVWNEPNLKGNCPNEACNGKEYGEFLVGTSKRIRNAQEAIKPGYQAKILTGGLFEERWNYSVASYINALAQAPGIKAAYDGLSLHPYALGQPGENSKGEIKEGGSRSYIEKSAAVPENINAAYVAQKNAQTPSEGTLGAKPIWITEIGWPVLGTEKQTVSLSEQASLLTDSYNWLKANASGYNIKYAAWYFYQDSEYSASAPWAAHCGLRNIDGSWRASWFAYESAAGVAKWPPDTSSGWPSDNLGSPNNAGIQGDPEISSWGKTQLHVWVRAADWGLYDKYYNPTNGWSGWMAVPNSGGRLAGGPGAVSWGDGRVDVVARGTSNQVLHWSYDVSNPQWFFDESLGAPPGGMTGDPDLSSWGKNRLDLFARGSNGYLWHRWYNGSGWGNWEQLPGGVLGGGPSAVSWGEGRIDVVARGTSGQILHWSWDKSNSIWYFDESLGGQVLTDPAIASQGPGRLDIVAEGSNFKLVHLWYNGFGWSPWEELGGSSLAGGAGAVSWGPNRVDVVARAYDDSVYHTTNGGP